MSAASFDWTKIAGPLIDAGAKVVGGAIGGPGGAAIGAAIGPIIADALGADPTPDAVADAVAADPAAAARVERDRALELQAAMIAAQTQALAIVNDTYRAELASDHWAARSWRPAFGMCAALVWTVHGLAIAHAMFLRDFSVLSRIPDLTVFYGFAGAVVGVYAWRRTDEKLAGASSGLKR